MESYINELLRKCKQKRVLNRIIAILSIITLLLTLYGLKQRSDALSRIPMCGLTEHVHTSECYDGDMNLVCGKTEHVHTDACYQERPDEATVADYSEVEAESVDDIPDESDQFLSLDDVDLEPTLDDINGNSDALTDDAAAAEYNDDAAEEPVFTLGHQARLSEIIEAAGLKIRLKSVEEVGVVDIDGTQADSLSIKRAKKDYTITALRDFDSVELALVLKNEIKTIQLIGGVAAAPGEGESPTEQDVDTSAAEDGQPAADTPSENNEQTTLDPPSSEDVKTIDEGQQSGLTLDAALTDGQPEQDGQPVVDQQNEQPAQQESEQQEQAVADEQTEVGFGAADGQGDAESTEGAHGTAVQADGQTGDEQTGEESDDVQVGGEQTGEASDDVQVGGEQTREESGDVQVGDEQTGEVSDDVQVGGEQIVEESDDVLIGGEQTGEVSDAVQVDGEQSGEESDDAQVDGEQSGEEQIGEEQTNEEQPGNQSDDEQSDEEQPDAQSGDEQNGEESGAEQSGEQVSEEQTGDAQVGGDQSDDEQSGEEQPDAQSGDEQNGKESGAEQSGEQSGEEQTNEDQSGAEQSGEEQTSEDQSGADQSGEEQTNEEQPGDQTGAEQTAEQTGEEQTDEEQTGDAETGEEKVEQPEQPGEVSHTIYKATIDLSNVEAYPLSLNEMMASAQAASLDGASETASAPEAGTGETGEEAEDTEEEGAGGVCIEYDETLLSIEAADEDRFVTPLASFEETQISVGVQAVRYELTLLNCTLPEPKPAYPAQHFEESTETMKVVVDAPEGAFPEGTTISVSDVVDQQTISDIEETVAEDFVEVKSVHAVDISFWYNGDEIEPLLPISVVMNVREAEQPQDPVVVHVDDEGAAKVVDSEETGEAEVFMEMPAGEEGALNDAPAGQEGTEGANAPETQDGDGSVAFSADSFSIYAVVFTETIETRYIDASGDSWIITVGYSKDANIPAGATLKVSEVMGEDAEAYLAQTAEALRGQETITLARFFDIAILDEEGREVQPAEPVEVRATLSDGSEDAVKAVHFDDGGEMQILNAEHDEESVAFNAESFSVYGIVYTVDFHWNANGETFEYSIVGGGAMSLRSLVEMMDVLGESPAEAADAANSEAQSEPAEAAEPDYDAFMAQIESVTFSDETLVKPVPVSEDITAGMLIEQWGLEPVYSAELTEEDIAALNAATFRAPDWALVSLKAFDSEESLSIAMRNGDTITISVTDAQLTKTVISASGQAWLITVTYGREAGIPEGAELEVSEILPDEQQDEEASEYDQYVSKTQEALGFTTGEFDYIRLFDIKIVDANGEKVDIAAPVDVKVELADKAAHESEEEAQNTQVVHFADGSESGDVVDIAEIGQATNAVDGTMVRFEASGFSVYAIVSGPSGAEAGWSKLTSLESLTTKGYYIGHTSGYFLTNTATSKTSGENTINGIKRTARKAVPTVSGVALYYFENASDGKYYIYCMADENKKYVVNNADASLSFGDESDRTAFTVEVNGSAVFKIHNEDWYWNMQSGTGEGFYAKKSAKDGNNNLYLWEQTDPNTDTYGLDGKSYGLMTWAGGKTAKALMGIENAGADENNEPYSGCLEAKFLTVMTHESNAGNKLYVPNNTLDNVTMWTFEWVGNDPANRVNSYYYLRENNGKYLKISTDGLSLVDAPDETCKIQVKPGTGKKEGQICLKSVGSNSKTLTYSGEYAKGYNVGGTAGSEWLYLVDEKPEELLADYEKVYTATKVSVSDTENVNTGAKIIIYARQWKNDHYEYYAINSKGELVPCVESGDTIEWYGGNVNDMLWQFTEYVYEGTDTPNGYYELENLYARSKGEPSYLAPKYSDGSILSTNTVGVLLQGRTDQQYYSPIVAWDTPKYMYSALTVDLNQNDPVLEPCVRADGLDFYFAIVKDLPVDDVLHEVPTVNNDDYGIVMKMKDFTNGKTNEMPDGSMNKFLQDVTNDGATYIQTSGLLSTKLGENGYPDTTRAGSGGSLANLYAGASYANHLFIDSIYRATGYYEYNSTQNFAYLTDSGDFRVYRELGTNDTTAKPTLQHGEFFPYNDIEAGRFASVNPENLYKINKDPLSDSDPRKHEQLYLVKGNTDYYFGMELEASFYQTPSGLDAWGHDIIFEFSGDDDFWLYVDGELVIDLGGIHSAMSGDVNFRTGVVHNNGETTTLYDVFKKHYEDRGDTEALANIDNLFTVNDAGQHVFNDNTPHTMRVFYMERGAGASNLHMKFNLATVKKGTVQLHKELEGENEKKTTYAVFPYQVYYTMEDDPNTEIMLRNAFDPNEVSADYKENTMPCSDQSKNYVFYKDSTKPVTFLPELEVDGATYYNVFMLKPDETAIINFPTKRHDPTGATYTADNYRIVECGIDPTVYTKVTVNGEEITGAKNAQNGDISDYTIPMASTGDRPKVDYVNKVENRKNLTFMKELYRKLEADTAPQKIELYGSDGKPMDIGEDPSLTTAKNATFDFRLYFKTPFDKDFSEAKLYVYHVKDPEGYYCAWNEGAGRFVRITDDQYPGYLKSGYENGTKDLANLTDDVVHTDGSVTHLGKYWASLETGTKGSISGIPAYYTVEVRDLIPGTEYRIVERPTETPDGYKFWQYVNDDLVRTDTDPYDPGDGIEGKIETDRDAHAVVRNYKGYGFRLEKVWADASTMNDRDPAYFALYKTTANGDPDALVDGSVRQLTYQADPQKLYWWYLDLPFTNTGMNDYAVFEVILEGDRIAVGNDGVVSGYDSIAPVSDGGIVTLKGTPKEQSSAKDILYKVTYAAPVYIGDNVKAFKATNTPALLPPVQFVKTDWDGKVLKGATFSLVDGNDNSVFEPANKTSDENGVIASDVYLQADVDYTLTELASPQGYVGIDPLTVRLEATSSGFELKVSSSSESPAGYSQYYKVTVEDGVLTLTVKNHPYEFEAVKVDSNSQQKLAGAQFSLYKQLTIGTTVSWDEDHPVFTDRCTDADGVIPGIGKDLPAGTYQLREKKAPSGYQTSASIDFTVSPMGLIELLGDSPEGVTLVKIVINDTGKIRYELTIPDKPVPLKLKKVDDSGADLTGAIFTLEKYENTNQVWEALKSGDSETYEIDMTSSALFELEDLQEGLYQLVETTVPPGYVILEKHVYFAITTKYDEKTKKSKRVVTLTDENGQALTATGDHVKLEGPDADGVYTIIVRNNPGVALPATGGMGTTILYVGGSILVMLAAILLITKRRMRSED